MDTFIYLTGRTGFSVGNFWDKIAAGSTPQQAPPQPVQHRTTQPQAPWWSPPPAPAPAPQAQPQQVPIYNSAGQIVGYTLVETTPGQPQDVMDDPHIQAAMRLAKSAKSTARCPNCDSGNYIEVKAHGTTANRCFDCGYNPMFEQQAAGVPTDPGSRTQPSRQAGTDHNNFNPKTFDPAKGGAGVVRL